MAIGALGAGIVSFFSAGAVSIAATSITAGIIGGAVVGAAIGGLTSAITGGSIGKGILFGAVGGAVTGGLGAWASGGTLTGPALSGQGMAIEGSQAAGYMTQHVPETAGTVAKVGKDVGVAAGSLKGQIGSALVTGGIDTIGKMMEGSAMEDMSKEQMENASKEAAAAREARAALEEKLAAMNNASRERIAGGQNSVAIAGQDKNWDIANRQLAEQKRQFDTGVRLDAEKLQRQQSAVGQAVASRKGALQGGQSIDVQVAEQEGALTNKLQEQAVA